MDLDLLHRLNEENPSLPPVKKPTDLEVNLPHKILAAARIKQPTSTIIRSIFEKDESKGTFTDTYQTVKSIRSFRSAVRLTVREGANDVLVYIHERYLEFFTEELCQDIAAGNVNLCIINYENSVLKKSYKIEPAAAAVVQEEKKQTVVPPKKDVRKRKRTNSEDRPVRTPYVNARDPRSKFYEGAGTSRKNNKKSDDDDDEYNFDNDAFLGMIQ